MSVAALIVTLALSTLAQAIVFGELVFRWSMPAALLAFVGPTLIVTPLAGRLLRKLGRRTLLRTSAAVALLGTIAHVNRIGTLDINTAVLGISAALAAPVKYALAPMVVLRNRVLRASIIIAAITAVFLVLGIAIAGAGPHGRPVAVIAAVIALLASFLVRDEPYHRDDAPLASPTAVRHTLLGIGWFWLCGTLVVGLLTSYATLSLGEPGDAAVDIGAWLVIGFILGALTCSRLSRGVLEIGVVPVGAAATSIFALALAIGGFVPEPQMIHGYVASAGVGLGLAWQVIPLYAFVQDRSDPKDHAKLALRGDLVSSTFVLIAAGLLWLIDRFSVPAHLALLVLALINVAVAIFIYELIPEFMLRFVAWALSRLMYRVKVTGRENLPRHGPAVLVCNHVTFIDWLIISAASPVPLRFVMHYSFINMPVARHVFKDAKLIPIAGAKEDAKVLDAAFDAIADALKQGEVVCIFPEGKLTTDGNMNAFRPGIEKIIARTPAPVVPMALVGMWGSFFSKAKSKGFMKRVRSRVKLIIAKPVSAADVKADTLEQQIKQLGSLT